MNEGSRVLARLKRSIDIEWIREYETDSSHSNFWLVCDSCSRLYICKEVYDTTLAGTELCVRYEYTALDIASRMGLAPKPILFDEELRILVVQYVDAEQNRDISFDGIVERAKYAQRLSTAQVEDERLFLKKHDKFEADIAGSMRLLQEAEEILSREKIKPGLDVTKRNDCAVCSEELDKFELVSREVSLLCTYMEDELAKLPYVLSHNDLVADNFL